MTTIKIIILAIILLFLIAYPILQKIKSDRMIREIERRDEARRVRQRWREMHEAEDEVFTELGRRREEFMRQHGINLSPAENIRNRRQRQEEPQEEFLTERDFQL